ncbi:MAG: hypothetical protein KDA90_08940 [Planctomycetaceae bacterium]|nr:hypothetical protein [Planctomycetaceae bacterium]
MSLLICTYLLYLLAALYVTVVIGQSLHHHGRPFLMACFSGQVGLADAVNHLLLVGYYLTNFALAAFLLQSNLAPLTLVDVLDLLSRKLGIVLLILGTMHAGNLLVLSLVWRRFHRIDNSGAGTA